MRGFGLTHLIFDSQLPKPAHAAQRAPPP
ncbi:MAG: hypothetical protein D6709_10850 [Chloroflexi bacterium]|nr:MAG: hypothetical protein D6709_10850 [Chloroflexota bacterium]